MVFQITLTHAKFYDLMSFAFLIKVLVLILTKKKAQGHLARKSFAKKFSNWIHGCRGRVSFLLEPPTN